MYNVKCLSMVIIRDARLCNVLLLSFGRQVNKLVLLCVNLQQIRRPSSGSSSKHSRIVRRGRRRRSSNGSRASSASSSVASQASNENSSADDDDELASLPDEAARGTALKK